MLVSLSRNFNKSPEEVSSEELKEYLYDAIHHRGLSSAYVKQTLSALKILYRDVLNIPWSETVLVKMPRKDHQIPKVLTKGEILMMIEVTANVKHKAIIALLYSSGMRRD